MVGGSNFTDESARSRPFGAWPLVHRTLDKLVASNAKSSPVFCMIHTMPLVVPLADSDAPAVRANVCVLWEVGEPEINPLAGSTDHENRLLYEGQYTWPFQYSGELNTPG